MRVLDLAAKTCELMGSYHVAFVYPLPYGVVFVARVIKFVNCLFNPCGVQGALKGLSATRDRLSHSHSYQFKHCFSTFYKAIREPVGGQQFGVKPVRPQDLV